MEKSLLKEIVLDQQKISQTPTAIERDIFSKIISYADTPFIIVISGLRRCGKSTLLHQIREKYPGYFLNFDDERLVHFTVDDFQKLYDIFLELFGEKSIFYFDEIQNISGWERFVRRLHDMGKKVFVTGSNASMLSRELGTHLTGRYLEINLYPFSFKEFLKFKEINTSSNDAYVPESRALLKRLFDEYLVIGGLPEYLKQSNAEYLQLLYESILYRDIIVRYNLSKEKTLKELIYFVAGNIGKELSFNSLKKMLNLGSPTTIKEYFGYFENSFLVFLVSTFAYSVRKQVYLGKKAYLIDTGLAVNLGFRISKDLGRLLENLVFIELMRQKKECYYEKGTFECDFVIKEGTAIVQAIQVCYELSPENKERENKGLLEALKKYKLKEGLILTDGQEGEEIIENKKIITKPVWKWLIS